MTVSPDVIGVIVTIAVAVGGLFGGLTAMQRAESGKLEKNLDALKVHVAARFDKVDAQLERVETDLTDVKVAIARLEGPIPRLSLPR